MLPLAHNWRFSYFMHGRQQWLHIQWLISHKRFISIRMVQFPSKYYHQQRRNGILLAYLLIQFNFIHWLSLGERHDYLDAITESTHNTHIECLCRARLSEWRSIFRSFIFRMSFNSAYHACKYVCVSDREQSFWHWSVSKMGCSCVVVVAAAAVVRSIFWIDMRLIFNEFRML